MAVSQNGYYAGRSIALDNQVVPGSNVHLAPGVRKGDVATVLFWVAEQFHKNVEPLVSGKCGGYCYRPIRGASALSNHASGTAIDLNWGKHVLGAKGTFSAKQVKEIRKILAFCEGVVRWGGDYHSRKDEMHFEINGSLAQVEKVAKKIRALKNPPKPAPVKKAVKAPVVATKAVYHTIKKGEFLSKVAAKYKLSLAKLLSLNPRKKKNPDAVDVGERIRVK